MKTITSPNLPKSNGHYAQAIAHNGVLYMSGQLPIEPGTRNIPDTIEEQTELALRNVARVLKEAGTSINRVLQVRIYISNIALWDKVNRIYASFFGNHKPVRSVVPVRDLHFGCLIEIEATAVLT